MFVKWKSWVDFIYYLLLRLRLDYIQSILSSLDLFLPWLATWAKRWNEAVIWQLQNPLMKLNPFYEKMFKLNTEVINNNIPFVHFLMCRMIVDVMDICAHRMLALPMFFDFVQKYKLWYSRTQYSLDLPWISFQFAQDNRSFTVFREVKFLLGSVVFPIYFWCWAVICFLV